MTYDNSEAGRAPRIRWTNPHDEELWDHLHPSHMIDDEEASWVAEMHARASRPRSMEELEAQLGSVPDEDLDALRQASAAEIDRYLELRGVR